MDYAEIRYKVSFWAFDFKSSLKHAVSAQNRQKNATVFSLIMIFSPTLPHELVTIATRNDLEYVCVCRFSCIHTVFEFIMS